ncbi:MAG: response regulator [Anaeromyxobacter sp.]
MEARFDADVASGDAARLRWADQPITLASGEVRYVTAINIPIPEQGMMVATVQDVTRQVLAQEALEDSEAILRSAVESAPLVLFLLDTDLNFRLSIGGGLSSLGLQPGQVVGMRLVDVYPELPDALTGARRALEGQSSTFFIDARGFTWDLRYTPLVGANGKIKGVVGTAFDVTDRLKAELDRTRLQTQLIQAQKMEAVGQLAGGVAHDFNNILTAILSNVELMREEAGLGRAALADLAELEADARRAASLTRQLLLFSRRQPMQPRPIELNALVGDLLKMLHRLIGEQIVLDFAGSPGDLWLQADGGMLDQAVTNLVVNARDAMPSGGEILLRLRAVEVQAPALHHPEARPGQFACLEVTDSGHGMDAETARHAFEPFFTTKDVGKGTGLGLATVHGIVQQHRGWVELETRPGAGTTFRVLLPLAEAPQGLGADEPADAPHPPGTLERLLVVEDDASVRRVLVRSLERLGYRVRAAASGVEALELWRSGGADLVLTDVMMPGGLNGLELAERLLAEEPQLRVVVMSGYSPELTQPEALRRRGAVFLAKPLDTGVLARTVRELLDGPVRVG